MQNTLEIEGLDGKQELSGEIEVHGGKNSALIALPAAFLFQDGYSIENVPDIEDVSRMTEIMAESGAKIKREKNTVTVEIGESIDTKLNSELVGKIRASIFLVGPLLARYGSVQIPHPGGDNIGPRPVDLFIDVFTQMGATCKEENGVYKFTTKGKLKGADIFLRIQSVGVTQSAMLAAVLAEGITTIRNAAQEPEISDLAEFLNSCGANISGIGSSTLTIVGGDVLSTKKHVYEVIPDRLDTGTFLILGVLAAKNLKIVKCNPKHLDALIEIVKRISSSEVDVGEDFICVTNKLPLTVKETDIQTHEYPGLPSDMQPQLAVLLTQASGKSLIFETIYEGRLAYGGNLIQMGADIVTYDPHRASIRGKTPLKGSTISSPDIRAGLAYVLAATIAKGKSVIHNVYCIDRGYARIEERLANIGLKITRK